MHPPTLNQHLRFLQRIEQLAIQKLIPELTVKALIIAILPRAKRWSYFVGQVGGVFKVESRFNNYAAIA
jgi:hypothetical protein